MGADWIRKAEEHFRHQLRDASHKKLRPIPDFLPGGKNVVTYPCHWLREDYSLPRDTFLMIFQRTDKSRVAVLHDNQAVAEIRGEAASDVKEIFRNHPELCNALAVRITKVAGPNEPFYVQPVIEARSKAAEQ